MAPCVILYCFVVVMLLASTILGDFAWIDGAHATYYGGSDAMGTNDGACGYGNQVMTGYGVMTTALSTPLFDGGNICGACFEVRCSEQDSGCLSGNPTVLVTATNLCPSGSNGGWCDLPNYHFDLSQPAFSQIAVVSSGHVPIQYRRVTHIRITGQVAREMEI